jgi:hypothetical protein
MSLILAERPANGGLLRIGHQSPGSDFGHSRSEIADSLRRTFEKLPFLGNCGRRRGSICTAWPSLQWNVVKCPAHHQSHHGRVQGTLRQAQLPDRQLLSFHISSSLFPPLRVRRRTAVGPTGPAEKAQMAVKGAAISEGALHAAVRCDSILGRTLVRFFRIDERGRVAGWSRSRKALQP